MPPRGRTFSGGELCIYIWLESALESAPTFLIVCPSRDLERVTCYVTTKRAEETVHFPADELGGKAVRTKPRTEKARAPRYTPAVRSRFEGSLSMFEVV